MSTLRPYQDVDWEFAIFSCLNCGSRFTFRDPGVNYYEILHGVSGSSYGYHYDMAGKVKKFLRAGHLDRCERYLRKAGYKYAEVIDFVRGKNKPLSILEIGCSTGVMTAFFRAHGHGAEGIDISQKAIDYATSTFGPFYSLNPSRERYDLIFHLGLIGCVENPKTFLSGFLQRLDTRGEMIFNAPNVRSAEELDEVWVTTPPPDLISLFREEAFRSMCGDSADVAIRKVYGASEIAKKNIRVLTGRKYAHFPISFRTNRREGKGRIFSCIKGCLGTSSWSLAGMLWSLRLFKRYENEYGLIVVMTRKSTGEI